MTHPHATPAAHPLDEVFVLHGSHLRPNTTLVDTARFRDDTWSLRQTVLQKQQKTLTLNFTAFPGRYRLAAKELGYAMLSGPLPPGERRPEPTTVHSVLSRLKVFLTWLDSVTPPGPAAEEITEAELLDFSKHLHQTVRSTSTRATHRTAVRTLWRFRTGLSSCALPFDPRHLQIWSEPNQRSGENATSRIPEQVHGPLLAWSLRLIDDFAADILAATHEWTILRDRSRRPAAGRNSGLGEQLEALLADHAARSRPLPGWRGGVNIRMLADTLACATSSLDKAHRHTIDAAAARLGVSAYAYFDIPITGQLDGQPWTDGIITDSIHPLGLPKLARILHGACYTAIGFLSGMRDNEIKHLRRGCLSVERDEHGQPYRWKVTSLAFKGENDPHGVEATWIVGAPAARAIAVIEQLQPPGRDYLFDYLPHSPGAGQAATAANATAAVAATNQQLNDLLGWINTYCQTHGRDDGIPLVNGHVWKLSTRQLRRTLAWFIARRPGGVIAGAIAYRHHSIHMFEGYAGTSDSGFRAEVEAE
jgi:hypothetical protein